MPAEELNTQQSPLKNFLRSTVPLASGILLAIILLGMDEGAFPGFMSLTGFYSKVLKDIGIAIILAVSLNIVNGYTGQFSLGHAGFMAIGAYTSVLVTFYGSFAIWGEPNIREPFAEDGFILLTQFGPGDLLFLGALLAGGLTAAIMGYIVGLPSLRLRGDYLAIVTLGFGEIVRVIFQNTNQVIRKSEEFEQASFFDILQALGGPYFSGAPFYTNLFWIYLFVAITIIVAYRLKYSSSGRAFLSIRDDEIAAESMGVNTAKYKVRAFVISAFFAGIAGGLFAHLIGVTLNPKELAFIKSVEIVIFVVLGGMGSITGSVVAATGLTILPELLRDLAQYRMIIYALLLIIVMIFRPQGIFGLNEISDVYRWIKRKMFSSKSGNAKPPDSSPPDGDKEVSS